MRYIWFWLIVTILCLAPQRAFAQAATKQPVLERIFADWRERQGLLKTARYVISGTTEFKDKQLPAGNPVRPRREVVLLDLERKRWRLESSEEGIRETRENGREYGPRIGTVAFDGTAVQQYYFPDLNRIDRADLGISKGKQDHTAQMDACLWPLFFAHGIVATVQHGLIADDLPTVYDPENFELRGRLPFQGRSCTVLRTAAMPGMAPIFDEIWIDLSQKSAIHRHVNFSGSDPWFRTDVNWKQTDFGWWPDQWTLTWTVNRQVKRVHRLRVESFEPNVAVADADFTLEAKPGMKVEVAESIPAGKGLNPYLPATKTYLISPSGSWQEVSAKGYTTLEGIELPPEGSRSWVWWTVGAAAVAGALALVQFALRHRPKKAMTRGQ